MKAFLCLVLFVLVGCASKLHPDNVSPLSAWDARYPTIELYVKNTLYNGLAVTSAQVGSNWQDLSIEVQGYNEGQVRVTSNGCNLDKVISFKDNQRIKLPITGKVEKDCVFGISMGFTLPKQKESGVKVWPIIGWVYVRALDKEEWVGTAKKVSGDFRSTWKIQTGDTKPVMVYLNGCGVKYQKELTPKDGIINIELREAMSLNVGFCILDGVLVSPDFKNLYLNAGVVQYDIKFVPLAIPTYTINKNKITVNAEESVTIIGVDDKYAFDNTEEFDFDVSKNHIVRALTVKGRTVFGQYNGKNGAWKWLQ